MTPDQGLDFIVRDCRRTQSRTQYQGHCGGCAAVADGVPHGYIVLWNCSNRRLGPWLERHPPRPTLAAAHLRQQETANCSSDQSAARSPQPSECAFRCIREQWSAAPKKEKSTCDGNCQRCKGHNFRPGTTLWSQNTSRRQVDTASLSCGYGEQPVLSLNIMTSDDML